MSFTALYIDDGKLRGDDESLLNNLEFAVSMGAKIEKISAYDLVDRRLKVVEPSGIELPRGVELS